jgi:hypothetical protein
LVPLSRIPAKSVLARKVAPALRNGAVSSDYSELRGGRAAGPQPPLLSQYGVFRCQDENCDHDTWSDELPPLWAGSEFWPACKCGLPAHLVAPLTTS